MSVVDHGTGIPAEIRDRIFDAFFTTKPEGVGTGLGLSTVLGIVSSYGGFVSVDTAAGRGSAFHVFLPAAASETDLEGDERGSPARGNQELILIVDDDVQTANYIAELLSAQGYKTAWAFDGEEALAKLQRAVKASHNAKQDYVSVSITASTSAQAQASCQALIQLLLESLKPTGQLKSQITAKIELEKKSFMERALEAVFSRLKSASGK